MKISDMINAHCEAMRKGETGPAILRDDITAGDEALKKGDRVDVMYRASCGRYHAENNDFGALLEREDFVFVKDL